MELIIVAIIVVAVVLVLMFAGPSNSNRSIVNELYKPIEMPKYTQSTYARELRVKPYEEPVLIVPDNLTREVFDRTNAKSVKKEGAKAEAVFKKSKLAGTPRKSKSKKDDIVDNSSSNFDSNLAAMSASDDNHKTTSCTPNYSSRSCASPVESYSSSSYSSSSDSSSSSSCDSGGSCGGGD